MIKVRIARESDIDGVLALAKQAYPGMTTLPPERDVLITKLRNSVRSVAKDVSVPEDESYFLVMEDAEQSKVVGTAAVIACLGSDDQFYSYKLNKVTQSCKELDKRVSVQTLNLSNHFEGYSEVATLYLDKHYRQHGNGRLLARSRYLFMAQFRQRFPNGVMADLRGYFDESGNSPFWNAVGSHFFDMEFAEADLHGAIYGNQFIADLMPKHPIYINMLPASAQKVIGKCNVVGKPAMKMLETEGFEWNGHVDIFDAAPSVDAQIDNLVAVKNSRVATFIDVLSSADSLSDMPPQLAYVATGDIADFQACESNLVLTTEGVVLPKATVESLNLTVGDEVRYLLLQNQPLANEGVQ